MKTLPKKLFFLALFTLTLTTNPLTGAPTPTLQVVDDHVLGGSVIRNGSTASLTWDAEDTAYYSVAVIRYDTGRLEQSFTTTATSANVVNLADGAPYQFIVKTASNIIIVEDVIIG